MACCVIASFIIAQCVATMRRWGMFWGIVSVPKGESVQTVSSLLLRYLRSPTGRVVVFSLVAIEFAIFTAWVFVNHGEHIREVADVTWSRFNGETVTYANLCTKYGISKERLVLSHKPAS